MGAHLCWRKVGKRKFCCVDMAGYAAILQHLPGHAGPQAAPCSRRTGCSTAPAMRGTRQACCCSLGPRCRACSCCSRAMAAHCSSAASSHPPPCCSSGWQSSFLGGGFCVMSCSRARVGRTGKENPGAASGKRSMGAYEGSAPPSQLLSTSCDAYMLHLSPCHALIDDATARRHLCTLAPSSPCPRSRPGCPGAGTCSGAARPPDAAGLAPLRQGRRRSQAGRATC